MILPIYTTIEKFNFRLVEAAQDLGANDVRAFLRVMLPVTLPGVMAGCPVIVVPLTTANTFGRPAFWTLSHSLLVIGWPGKNGLSDAGVGTSWFKSRCRPRCVPLLPT